MTNLFSSAKVFSLFGDKSVPLPPKEIDATSQPKGINVYWNSDEPSAKGFMCTEEITQPFRLY